MRLHAGERVFQRRFRLEPTPQTRWLILGRPPTRPSSSFAAVLTVDRAEKGVGIELIRQPDGLQVVRVPASRESTEFRVAMGWGSEVKTWETASESDRSATHRWPQELTTRGSLSSGTGAYVVDNIALPGENPWRRNLRVADIGFFKDGRAAVVTFDGDVWLVSGLMGNLTAVRWRRFTSGLHEPQSLCIRDEEIFVFDRNGIWRLRDVDRNGEAEVHELFSNAFAQTAETREYAQAMKLAPDGAFILGKGGIQMATLGKHNGTVMRVSADGKSAEVLGWGLRSPYLGVHPRTGLITASDQQGHYIPTTPLEIIRDRQFYGFLSNLLPKEEYPAPIAEPLTWIPYPVNASGAGQVWLTGARMGPLNDALLHFGYYRPEIFQVLLNRRASRMQAAVISVVRDLPFSPFNGAVNPQDGQLYFTGFQIFGTTAGQLSGLGRLRYTGAPSRLPREVIPMKQGVLLRFDVALDETVAADAANYSAERWNYQRTSNYGSPHFKLDGSKGQEVQIPTQAYLSKDQRSVFVGIADLKTVMQMRLGWALSTKAGEKFEQNAYFTVRELGRFDPVAEGFGAMRVNLTPRVGAAAVSREPTVE